MNILVYYPHTKKEHAGGLETYLHEYTQRLMRMGHEVHLVCFTTKDESYDTTEEGIFFHYVSDPSTSPVYKHFAKLYRLRRFLSEFLKQHDFDVANVHGSGGLDLLYPKTFSNRIPLIYFFHASHPLELRFDYVKKKALEQNMLERAMLLLRYLFNAMRFRYSERRALRLARSIIADSPFDRHQIRTIYGSDIDRKTSVIPIGVDTEMFHPPEDKNHVRRTLGLPGDRTLLLCVRRLAPRMGLLNLLEAVEIVLERHHRGDFILLIGGRGELEGRLRTVVTDRNLTNNVRLLGFVEQTELVKLYQAADVFILPSEDLEGFGIVTLEALASGLPVIGTPAGATPDILKPLNPDLLTVDVTPEAIAEKIVFFLENKERLSTPDRYRDYVKKKYNWDHSVKQIEQVLIKA